MYFIQWCLTNIPVLLWLFFPQDNLIRHCQNLTTKQQHQQLGQRSNSLFIWYSPSQCKWGWGEQELYQSTSHLWHCSLSALPQWHFNCASASWPQERFQKFWCISDGTPFTSPVSLQELGNAMILSSLRDEIMTFTQVLRDSSPSWAGDTLTPSAPHSLAALHPHPSEGELSKEICFQNNTSSDWFPCGFASQQPAGFWKTHKATGTPGMCN